jgi:hypothetical protein
VSLTALMWLSIETGGNETSGFIKCWVILEWPSDFSRRAQLNNLVCSSDQTDLCQNLI